MNRIHIVAPLVLIAGVHIHAVGGAYLGQDAQAQEIVWQRDLDTATQVALDSTKPLLVVFR
jgi:hypothetical protein